MVSIKTKQKSLQENLFQLTNTVGLSGNEKAIAEVLVKKLREIGVDGEIDAFGNVTGFVPSSDPNAPVLLLEAHLDQIGLMISGIDKDGTLQFVNIGGVDERILPGMEVVVHGIKDLCGVIGAFLPEAKDGEEVQNPSLEEYRIDLGLEEEEVKKLVHSGDWVHLAGSTDALLHQRFSGCAMDNRSGIVAVLHALSRIQKEKIPYSVKVLFSTQEELGLHGAFTGLGNEKISAAIVVDVTHGTTADTKDEVGVFPLGCGAVICRGPNLHRDKTNQLLQLAKEKGVSHEIEVASGGSGTTAWAIQIQQGGIPVMLLSIPLKYMHTNVETLELNDIAAVSDLICEAAKGGILLDS